MLLRLVLCLLTAVSVVAVEPLRVNFQPERALTPAGYLADTGAVFGQRADGMAYGWDVRQPVALADRDAATDPGASWLVPAAGARWELTLAPGRYRVLVAVGGRRATSRPAVAVEGATLYDGTRLLCPGETLAEALTVEVLDGRLTLAFGLPGGKGRGLEHGRTELTRVEVQALPAVLPGEYVGPFRWARKLLAEAAADPVAIAVNDAVETAALVAGSDAVRGVVATTQWSGANQAGGRSWSANTLVGDPGRNYFVGLRGWRNTEALDTGAGWIEVARMQQDAHLRLAFVNAAAAELAVVHGTGFGLDDVVPAAALVLDLSFRRLQGSGDSVWQTGYYRGTPVQLGVWQVPAGQSLAQAQREPANRLAALAVLGEITPDDPFLVKLQVQPGGAWQVLIDLDGDGAVDVDVVAGDAAQDARPYDPALLGDLDESSGLLVTASPAGGTAATRVGLTRLPLAYVASPSAPVSPVRDRRPLRLNAPLASAVSPARICGRTWTGGLVLTVEPNVGLGHFPNGRFDALIDLNPEAPTQFTATQAGTPPTVIAGAIAWQVTNLDEVDAITIRAGDSLLLACRPGYPTGELIRLDVYGDGSDLRTGSDDATHVVRYDAVGVYGVRAWRAVDGAELGRLTVTVVACRLPDYIAVQRGFTRELVIEDAADPVTVRAAPDAALTLTEVGRGGGTLYLTLTAATNDEPVLEARAGGPDGPLLDARAIATFELTELTGSVIPVRARYPDGSLLLEGRLRMTPLRPGLDLRLQIFVSGAAFEDGGLTLWLTSDDFTPDPDAPGTATASFLMVKSAGAPTGPCHNRRVYQAGVQVGR